MHDYWSKNMAKSSLYWVFALFLVVACQVEQKGLPILGPKTLVQKAIDGYKIGDTIYHQIPYFALINQEADTVGSDFLEGKPYIANFFFVNCPNICPAMTSNLWKIKQNLPDDFQMVSFTVNPEKDSPEVLKNYASKFNIDTKSWTFFTGDKTEIYELAAEGYFMHAQMDSLAPGGFLHSSQLILIDQKSRIRGLYDGLNPEDLEKLTLDAKKLHTK